LQAAIKDKYGITADLREGAGGIFTSIYLTRS